MTAEGGSASLLVAATLTLLLVLVAATADAGRLMVARATAQTAADAAALAAAPATFRPAGRSPDEEASALARANEARLVSCRCPVDPAWQARTVTVRVVVDVPVGLLGVGSVPAMAAAEFDPTVWLRGEP